MVMNYGYNYNPMANAQQRLAQYEAQYPQYTQPVQQPQGMRVLPVTNVEEANATQVDVQGTPTFFFNQAKNEVYMKRVNLNTGLADFVKFERVQMLNNESKEQNNVITYENDFKALNDKIDGLYSLLINDQVKIKNGQVIDQVIDQVKNRGGKNAK